MFNLKNNFPQIFPRLRINVLDETLVDPILPIQDFLRVHRTLKKHMQTIFLKRWIERVKSFSFVLKLCSSLKNFSSKYSSSLPQRSPSPPTCFTHHRGFSHLPHPTFHILFHCCFISGNLFLFFKPPSCCA